MKTIHALLFSSLLLLAGCQKNERIAPTLPGVAKQTEPFGILAFAVEGVPQENIRFTTLDANEKDIIVVVSLPGNLPATDSVMSP